MNGKFTNPAFLASTSILLLTLFVRSTRGLDLTDEMQYYGQIKGLIETGRLFSNDLFIQQLVYILFYPAFYVYHFVFGFEGLVLFGRLLTSFACIGVFLYAYLKLTKLGWTTTVASITALGLVFAIPYHGIFALSYNTVSQVVWIVFTLKYFEWKRSGAIAWGIFPIIMSFAHPTSAVMMSFLIIGRLWVERERKQIGRLLLVFLGGGVVTIPILLYFAAPQEYLTSITFSAGYGVGTSFFSAKEQAVALVLIYAVFLSVAVFVRSVSMLTLSILTILSFIIAIILFSLGTIHGGYSQRIVYILSLLSVMAYALALFSVPSGDTETTRRIHWLIVLLLSFAATLALTSGNGLGQSTGAFMVGLPLLVGIAAKPSSNREVMGLFSSLNMSCVILVSVLFVTHWSRFPYREDRWWNTNYTVQSIPEFGFIRTSFERAEFVRRMQKLVQPMVANKKTLIVGGYSFLYFASNAVPQTCMFFLHSITSDQSAGILHDCLQKRPPEFVLDFSSEGTDTNSVLKSLADPQHMVCTKESIVLDTSLGSQPRELTFTACRQAMGRANRSS